MVICMLYAVNKIFLFPFHIHPYFILFFVLHVYILVGNRNGSKTAIENEKTIFSTIKSGGIIKIMMKHLFVPLLCLSLAACFPYSFFSMISFFLFIIPFAFFFLLLLWVNKKHFCFVFSFE